MAAELQVKINKKIEVSMFQKNVNCLLSDFLNVSESFKIIFQVCKNKDWSAFQDEFIGSDKQFFTVKLRGDEDGVNVTFTQIDSQLPYITEDEAGMWAGISVGLKKTPIEIILAASIAITIARYSNTFIIDNAGLWSTEESQNATDFIKSLQLNLEFQDYLERTRVYLKTISS